MTLPYLTSDRPFTDGRFETTLAFRDGIDAEYPAVQAGPTRSVDDQFAWGESEAGLTTDDLRRRHDIHFRRAYSAAGLDYDGDINVVFEASTSPDHSSRETSASSRQIGRGVTTSNAI